MRLLFLTPEFDGAGGGVFTYASSLIPMLRGHGIEPVIFEGSATNNAVSAGARMLDGVRLEKLEVARYRVWRERFCALSAAPGLRNHLAAAWALWEQAGRGAGFDVIEASDYGLLFVPPAIEATLPLVVQCHGSVGQISVHDPIVGDETDGALTRLIERAVLTLETCEVQTCSGMNARFWEEETGRHVGHAAPSWARPPVKADGPVSDRGLVVGRVQSWKGPQVLCEATRLMGAAAPPIDWVGRDTVWRARGRSSAGELARAFPDVWGPRIVHLPPLDPEMVARLQAGALFNLVPSIWDVFNFTAAEGLASGRPTIVSAGAGASELIEDGRTGYVFESGNAAALADTMRRVMRETPERLCAIGKAGRELVTARLNPAARVLERRDLYARAIARRATGAPAPVTGWLGDICRGDPRGGDEYAFLSRIPLRMLGRHLLARINEVPLRLRKRVGL